MTTNATIRTTRRIRGLIRRGFGEATVREDGAGLLFEMKDPTSPTGVRTFVVEVREIDPPEDGYVEVTVPATDDYFDVQAVALHEEYQADQHVAAVSYLRGLL